MKSIFILLLAALAFAATAQPHKIHYQGLAVAANGKPIKNSTVGLRLSVLDSLPTGNTLYTETQTASTDAAGIFSTYLGGGTATAGTFANLPWANENDKFLKVEMDAQGGSNYHPMGITQLVSVPYAMAAGNSKLISDQFGNSIQIKYDGNGNPFIALVTKPIAGCNGNISIQGESYPIVQIGSQCWMAKNLNVGTMIISSSTLDSQRNNGVIEKYCYNNDPANCVTYGGLYQWAEAVQYFNGASNTANPSLAFESNVKGICPVGWHIPNDLEWGDLEIFLGGSSLAGGALKSISSLWIPPTIASNRYGFSILPAGFISPSGGSQLIGNYANFWTSTITGYSNSNAYYRELNSSSPVIGRSSYLLKENAFSIRCILDTCNPVSQANAGADQLNVCANSVNLVGNTPNNGSATWSILSGTGGSLGTPNAATIPFTGTRGNSYSLRYSITNACGSSADTVAVSLAPITTPANAGPDQLNLTGTTATLAANAPASGETGAWSILSGNGGNLSSINNPTATFTKGTDTAYTLVWTITGPCGSSSDTVNLRFPAPVGTACGQAVTYAGETYPTVQIGTQCWFQRNVNAGTMVLGANDQTNNGVLEKYCYNNDTANCATYGGLYQWAEAVQYQNGSSNTTSPNPAFTGNIRGICPTGWHLPSDAEYCTLTKFLDVSTICTVYGASSSTAGGLLKSTSFLWTSPNTGALNSSGFSAIPGGYCPSTGTFSNLSVNAGFWTSSQYYRASEAIYFGLFYLSSSVLRGSLYKNASFSARCTQD